jgi:hypothetical protein
MRPVPLLWRKTKLALRPLFDKPYDKYMLSFILNRDRSDVHEIVETSANLIKLSLF